MATGSEKVDADVYLCGFGLSVPEDLTLGLIEVMRRVSTVFCLPVPDWPAELPRPAYVEDLGLYYSTVRDREASYVAMAAAVVGAARERGPVAVLTYGHAIVGMDATQHILQMAHGELSVAFLNAPSSIEAVCAVIGYDPFGGLTVVEANRLLECRTAAILPLEWPLMVMQMPYIGAASATHMSQSVERFDPSSLRQARDVLADAYGPNHEVGYVRARILGLREVYRRFPIRDLVAQTPASAATLVVPPRLL